MKVYTRNWASGLGMWLKKSGRRRAALAVIHKHTSVLLFQSRNCVPSQKLISCAQMNSAHNEAVSHVVDECQKRQSNAVIAMRFDAADLAGFTQVGAYVTAALVEELHDAKAA